jgi:hypothetical protein
VAGVGLGLALVAHIAQRHGGSIAVTSTPGVGSTFTLTLPAVRDSLAMQLVHDIHLDSAGAGAGVGDRVDATFTAMILLLARRRASVFHGVGAATLFAFHG